MRDHALEVASLKAEHDALRTAVEKLGLEIELHEARLETVRALIERLRAHAKAEERTFYPWVERWAPSSSVMHVLRARLARVGP
jgi:hypothetical protein